MDDEQDYRAIKPYGDWGGVFVVNRKTYRIYRVYNAAFIAAALVAGNWILLDRTRPAYAWPLFWALCALAFYIKHRIVSSGKRGWANAQAPGNQSSRIVGFWLAQIAGWFLIAFAALAIWRDIALRGEIHIYEFPLLAIGAASIAAAFASRNRRAK